MNFPIFKTMAWRHQLSPGWWPRLAIGLLTLLSVLAFANTFNNRFAFDDGHIIVNNELIKDFGSLPKLFTLGYWAGARMKEGIPGSGGGLYRPLVLVTYAMNYALGGLNPFGYHLINLFLHVLVTSLLFLLAVQIGFSGLAAVTAAALFAVHPLHTEAVTGVVGRAELLMALGILLAVRWYIRGGAPAKLEPRYAAASLAAFAGGLLSKEQAMTLPFLLVLYDLYSGKRPESLKATVRGALSRYSTYLLILGVYLALRTTVLGDPFAQNAEEIAFLNNPLSRLEWPVRILTALKVAGIYLWLCVWPAKLSADYSYNAIAFARSFWEPGVLWAVGAWGVLLALAVRSYFRCDRRVFFAVGFTVIVFLPASNILIPMGTIMGERLFYLPSAGLCLLVAAGWDRLAGPGGLGRPFGLLAVVVLSAVLILLTARTIHRNRDWWNNESLFRSAVDVVPASAKVHFNVGQVSLHDDMDEAFKAIEKAFEIYPQYPFRHPEVANAYGALLLSRGEIEESVEHLKRAVTMAPRVKDGYYNLGLAYTKQRKWEEAEGAYRKALAIGLEKPGRYNNLSFVLWKQARYTEALAAAEAAVRLKPEFAEAHYNKAAALEALGRFDEAMAAYEQVLQLKPVPSAERRLGELKSRL
jgi:tetratricopeptide (TPR) repeat protein